MKKLKKLSSLLLVCLFIFSMTACSATGQNVMKALKNSMNITSCSYDGSATVKIDMLSDNPFLYQLNGYNPFPLDVTVTFDGKSRIDKNHLNTGVINYNVDFMDINYSATGYMDSKLENGQVNMEYLLKSPRFMKSMLGLGKVDADYLLFDFNTINQLLESYGIEDFSYLFNIENMKDMKANQEQALQIFEMLGKHIVPGKTATISNSKTQIKLNNKTENVDLISININNTQLKNFLKSFISDKESFEYFLDISLLSLPEEQREFIKEQTFANYEENSKLSLQAIDTMANVLGEDGINITLAINKDNYIVKCKVSSDILIEDIFALTLSYDINMYDINKPTKIDMPNKEKIKYVDVVEHYKNMVTPDNHNITLPESQRVKINGSVKDFFPFKTNTTYFYKDSESEELQKTTFDYNKDGLMQLTEDYGDYKFSTVYEVTDNQVKNIMFSDNDNNIDLTNSFPNSNELQLVSPFIQGTKWSNDYYAYEITDLKAEVKTEAGTYNAIEITSIYDDPDYAFTTKYYYAKNVGLVKVVYDYGEGETSTLELVKIEKNIK